MTHSKSFKYVVALGACILAMLALVPASFAGEDDGEDSTPTPPAQVQNAGGGGGGSDSGSASGGVQTGFGGMATAGGSQTLAIELAGGGVLLLVAAGSLTRRRVFDR